MQLILLWRTNGFAEHGIVNVNKKQIQIQEADPKDKYQTAKEKLPWYNPIAQQRIVQFLARKLTVSSN